MLSEVLEKVAGRAYTGVSASLHGWKRCQVQGESYPAVIESAEAAVPGILWLDISDSEFLLLDNFEGRDYRRVSVTVESASGIYPAQVYAWDKEDGLIDQPWSFEWFKAEGLKHFAKTYLAGD